MREAGTDKLPPTRDRRRAGNTTGNDPETIYSLTVRPLHGVRFGFQLDMRHSLVADAVDAFERDPAPLLDLFYAGNGLLVLKGLADIAHNPELLVKISRLFGPEVENYRTTITTDNFFHDSVDEILVLSNMPPCNYEPPPRTDPPYTEAGGPVIRFPQRRGWHTDQSYRRPPPDVSLLLGLACPPRDQGQTLYADCISAYEHLPLALKRRLRELEGVHALRFTGRTGQEVKAGAPLRELQPNQMPQRHRVVREHPVSGRSTLYLCDDTQMDFVTGPFIGMAPGPEGEGARLLDQLLEHITDPRFVYVHEWDEGDLVIHDNRNMLHTATWYDSASHPRLMWRTTVMGNPGVEYTGDARSWVPRDGHEPMRGLEDLEF